MKRITRVHFDDLNVEIIREASPDVLKVVKDNTDFYFMIKLKERSNNAVIFSNGAYDPQKSEPPVFMRSRLGYAFNGNCIYIDDVTIHNTNLRIGWGIGTPEKHYLKEYSLIVKRILKHLEIEDENTVYFGSSAGGFMSMGLSVLHKGSKAVANNPQFYATTYAKGVSLRSVFTEIFPNLDRKEVLEKYSDRFSITNMMLKYKHVPEILVVQNRLHEPDMKEQYEHFIKLCERYKIKLSNVEFLFYHSNNGHDAIPNQKAADLVNAKLVPKKKGILFVLDTDSEKLEEENVYQIAIAAREKGYEVYIAHKTGEFLTKAYRDGFNAIVLDFDNVNDMVVKIKRKVKNNVNIIHVHSGNSRKVGVQLNREIEVPLVITFNDYETYNVAQYSNNFEAILESTEDIKSALLSENYDSEEKIHVMPNFNMLKSKEEIALMSERLFSIYKKLQN